MLKCLSCGNDLDSDSEIVYSRISSVYSRSQDLKYFDLVKCDCGLMQTSPRITGKELSAIYETSYAYDFHDLVSSEKSVRAKSLSKIVGKRHDLSKIFEFGCAQGELLSAFSSRGWLVSGCEIGVNSQKVCRAKGLDVRLSDAESALSNLDWSTDLFVLSHVLEHLEAPQTFLTRLAEKAGSNSRLLLVVPNIETVQGTRFAKFWGYWQVPVHITHFSKHTLTDLAARSGWCVESIYYRSRDFLGFALTFANVMSYSSPKSGHGVPSALIKICSRVWSLFYNYGKSDLIAVLTPIQGTNDKHTLN